MSEFGTHEPQPNEGNGDANNHTSETPEQVAGPCHAGAHAYLASPITANRGKHGRLGAAKRPHAQRSATCSSHTAPVA